jgi:hypothetical protein
MSKLMRKAVAAFIIASVIRDLFLLNGEFHLSCLLISTVILCLVGYFNQEHREVQEAPSQQVILPEMPLEPMRVITQIEGEQWKRLS